MLFVKYVFFKICNFKMINKHQVGPKENFSLLALKGEAVSVAQISPYDDGGT
jgi:hypothetical protein